jgi:flavin reductase ActVB
VQEQLRVGALALMRTDGRGRGSTALPASTADGNEVDDIQDEARPSEETLTGFREAMSRLAAGVVMVTTEVEGKPWGLTVSACCSISMTPPLLLVSLGSETVSARVIERTGVFGVSLLTDKLIEVAQFGAARGAAKFVTEFCDPPPVGVASPAVCGALAHVDCRVSQTIHAGDHTVFLGAVQAVVSGDGEPLVYYARSYRAVADSTTLGYVPATLWPGDADLYSHFW